MTRARRGSHVTADTVAGVTVAIVLVPQSVAYAQLAGMPPEHGLYAAALPPLAAALVASSPYLQTGPVAITSLLTYGALVGLAPAGSVEYVALGGLLAVLIGVTRLVVSLIGAGALAYLISQPMLAGFMPAAAVLIIASQLPAFVGARPPDGGVLEDAGWTIGHVDAWSPGAVALGLVALALMLGTLRTGRRYLGPLLAVVVTAVASTATDYGGAVAGSLPDGLPPVTLDLPWSDASRVLLAAIVIALVGFAEPASIARTFATQDRSRWDPDREFASQGLANLAAGFSGGFPVGGSFSRSALNRIAGARTRLSGAVTGIAVLCFIPFAFVLEQLPNAALAAVVIGAALTLIRVRPLFELWHRTRIQFALAASTVVLTLTLAPHVERALLIGIVLAVAIHLNRELRLSHHVSFQDGTLRVRPSGVLWFGSAQTFEDTIVSILASHPTARRLVVTLDGVGRLDITAADGLRRVLEDVRATGIDVGLESVPPHAQKLIGQIARDLGLSTTSAGSTTGAQRLHAPDRGP